MFTTLGGGRYLLFGANTQRPPNEMCSLQLEHLRGDGGGGPSKKVKPAARGVSGSKLQMTYASIDDDVARANLPSGAELSVLLCRPAWSWGALLAANSAGVVIANAALFCTSAASKAPEASDILGTDHLRFVVERSTSAEQAQRLLCQQAAKHGQAGGAAGSKARNWNALHAKKDTAFYNAFLVCGVDGAFVVETYGKHWMCRRVESAPAAGAPGIDTVCSIVGSMPAVSTSDKDVTMSTNLLRWARAHSVVDQHGLRTPTHGAERGLLASVGGDTRNAASLSLMRALKDTFKTESLESAVSGMFDALRHHDGVDDALAPTSQFGGHYSHGATCAHASSGPVRSTQTTCSLVVLLDRKTNSVRCWTTGTSSPCLSMFKPVALERSTRPQWPAEQQQADAPSNELTLYNKTSKTTMWWRHERIARLVLLANELAVLTTNDHARGLLRAAASSFRTKLREEEATALKEFLSADNGTSRFDTAKNCFDKHDKMLTDMEAQLNVAFQGALRSGMRLSGRPAQAIRSFLFMRYWSKRNIDGELPMGKAWEIIRRQVYHNMVYVIYPTAMVALSLFIFAYFYIINARAE